MAADIIEFTDPGCPWAYSAEPSRLRIRWLYADAGLRWRPRMVVLARTTQEYTDRGLTPEVLAAGLAQIADAHGMPFELAQRPRVAATELACRAVVAARRYAPTHEAALLRRLRLRNFRGELLDEPATIAGAAADAGLDPADVAAWMEDPEVQTELEADAKAARDPMPAARVLDDKLAAWEGGRRYTCPSWEITVRDSVREFTIALPGFQPLALYEVALANALPDVARRPEPSDVVSVLRWAGEPLATQEVAVIAQVSRDEAASELAAAGAERIPLGTDALWTL